MPTPTLPVLLLALLAAAAVLEAGGGEEADRGDETALDGWAVVLEGGAAYARRPAATLALGAGESPHPLVAAADVEVALAALVEPPEAGRYRFGLELAGAEGSLLVESPEEGDLAAVAHDGAPRPAAGEPGAAAAWTEWLALEDPVRVVVRVRRDGDAPLRLRALWELAREEDHGFVPEPIPRWAARVPEPLEHAARAADLALRGRVLLERKGCTACHAPGDAAGAVGVRRAPSLARAGERLGAGWMRAWIDDPHRGAADMPRTVRDDVEAGLVAMYLASLGEAARDRAGPADPDEVAAGRELYHLVGCVACHGALEPPSVILGDPFLPDDTPAADVVTPLGDLAGKWRRDALARALLHPAEVWPDGRMPSFDLDEDEARRLAAYLAPGPDPVPWGIEVQARARGRALFVERGCVACHDVGEELAPAGDAPAPPPAPPLGALDPARGCLDPADEATPRYALAPDERRALAAGLAEARAAAPGADAPLDRAERRLALLACTACHARDGQGGVDPELDLYFRSAVDEADLGDEGRLPPELSDAGWRCTTSWLEAVLLGDGRARPYLAARMPSYAADAVDALPAALAKAAGVVPHHGGPEPEPTDALVLAGRDLMGRTALSCVACHVYKDYPPNGAPGPDVTRLAERLRYEWFRAFLQDPMRYRPHTRMPSFGRAGESTLRTALGGDLYAQVDALWSYFGLGAFMPPPDGVAPSGGGIPVAVGERPRVLRTFLEGAGSRGIAVGFPVGVHFGFDAGDVRLVDAWRGDFLDAAGAWAGRGGTVADRRGSVVWTAPPGAALWIEGASCASLADAPLAAAGRDAAHRFRGYRLEADGTPVLRYEVGDVRVEERWTPRAAPHEGFARAFRLDGVEPGARVLVRSTGRVAALADVAGAEVVAAPADAPPPEPDVAHHVVRATVPVVSLTLEVTP